VGKDVEVIPTTRKIVALTFDAGSNADGLPAILSTLSNAGVPATFFLTGSWAKSDPASVGKIVAAGHRLGNHTATHPRLTTLSDSAIAKQIETGRSQIMSAGGTDPKPLFRFPYGDRDAHTIAEVNEAGYVAVRWTVDTLGWKGAVGGSSAQTVIDRTVRAARPGEIVLMHVGSAPDHSTLDADALPTVISRLKSLGYGFVALDTLLAGSSARGAGVIMPGCDAAPWRTAPVTVTRRVNVPPVPVVTGIRTGSHPECRYDRLVVDTSSAPPGYEIRYVTSVPPDAADRPVTIPGSGRRYLLITLYPAQAHTDAGTSAVARKSAALGYPMLKGYTLAEDFEGYVTVALGLAATTQIRTGVLPGRVFVDVAY
jgi:peptidoglycan/xylan/chitin deacetylase (PgdA/CDA1 family)